MSRYLGLGPKRSSHTAPSASDILQDTQNFSLVLGGPLFQLLRRTHMADDAMELIRQRVIVITLVAWLPLLVLAALEGHLLNRSVAVPFLLDLEVHIRFLVAVPILIIAELVVHRRLRPITRAFIDRGIIPEGSVMRFDEAIRAAFRLRNSVVAELLLVALVYGVGILIVWRQYTALQTTATWYAVPTSGGLKLSLAGFWYGYVSVPIFQFLLVRWYFRLFIWSRFLWQVSRIDLNLVPTHPDRVGGLGFLANTVYAFTALLVAHGAMLAAQFAGRIFFAGAALTEFKVETGAMVCFLLFLVFGPFLVFAPQLARAKRMGLSEYGALAERYVREFDAKWLRGGGPAGEALVGSADIQSLADLANSFDVVRTMRIAPITRDAIVRLAAAVLVPIVPLALTMMSLEELLKRLFGLVF
ncbi:hypothetical protein [Paraburkholderia caribensis]|uniref:hypothetical protein n=1 Tax=Paraburkholderia caribensis TaxID=75105 RepID=UPI000721FFB2|nr:hypothetical protein [Paraburkholderia caribensis]ALP67146.1 hypothetical protein AN416_31105 [Paraburkholderia caribensis]AUT57720.1 hypothetical protein C2L66_34080 [Paraburkholderia caribensis]